MVAQLPFAQWITLMPSLQYYFAAWYLKRRKRKRLLNPDLDLARRRAEADQTTERLGLPPGTQTAVASAHGIPGEWVWVGQPCTDRALFYLHGGAYVLGSPQSHRTLTARLAQAANCRVFVPDYRLAPEHPFPAALDDAATAYDWFVKNTPGQKHLLAGDSAGGGLAVALMLARRDEQATQPDLAVLLAPWLDLTCESPAHQTLEPLDWLLSRRELLRSAQSYAASHSLRHPFMSPLFADLTGLPPHCLQVGTYDPLLDDSRAFAQKARAAGVAVTLAEWEKMPHVWQILGDKLPEAKRAIAQIGQWLAQC